MEPGTVPRERRAKRLDALTFAPPTPAATLPIAFRELQLRKPLQAVFRWEGQREIHQLCDGLDRPCRRTADPGSMLPRIHVVDQRQRASVVADRVEALGVSDQFIMEHASIRHRNGSEFVFSGLRITPEASKVDGEHLGRVDRGSGARSDTSLETLIPTIRQPGLRIRGDGQARVRKLRATPSGIS